MSRQFIIHFFYSAFQILTLYALEYDEDKSHIIPPVLIGEQGNKGLDEPLNEIF